MEELKFQSWYLDSGYSGQMTHEIRLFQSLTLKYEETVAFEGTKKKDNLF